MTYKEFANILFPSIQESVEDVQRKYPTRKISATAEVTRFGASPTGYINIGGLYTAFISWKLAKQTNGIFILRIEDNNQRDIVPDGIENFVNALLKYGISFDEGYFSEKKEFGSYGPYSQTSRAEIYQVFVKKLVEEGIAYPCFCSLHQLNDVRTQQRLKNEKTGYYGAYAKCRCLSLHDAAELAKNGKPFVIRIKAEYLKQYENNYYNDMIKGKVKLSPSDLDIVILKETGIPDYNFAHVVDDYLMGTTTITRCEDWLPSLHTHLALFNILGWKPPRYAHIGAISIKKGRSIIKISKKLGEKVTVDYYLKKGYIPEAMHNYFMMIACADFENYWLEHKEDEYKFSIQKMNVHGALLDEDKLNYVSKKEFDRLSVGIIFKKFIHWVKEYSSDAYLLFSSDSEYTQKIIKIVKGIERPRLAICHFEQLMDEIYPFFNAPHINQVTFQDKKYLELLTINIENQKWDNLNRIRQSIQELCNDNNIAVNDFCMALRRMIVGKQQSPSVYEMLMMLGKEKIMNWLKIIH